ncbi:hypothetical protein MC378_12115 [Polaribacter sp. MSW13]|uniref:PIN domain-containing protein n=1 Tax=Polaribacter marinus TaxID=2916838 RepID=A0A9X1VQC7_9FLAO|nr:hypothetical protein [Polaribacter marinus]MCI2229913.1 hypothetical protein [Polaribacter marinus]
MTKPTGTILTNFKIKIAIDTQLLAYLIDNTFPSFNYFFSKLNKSPFVDIVCSRFVTYEFIGIRKYEHYLRAIHQESQSSGGTMNFSSALKYRNGFKAPELDFQDCYQDIKIIIEDELKEMNDNYGIIYEDNILHEDLWKPHQDLVLSSRISKEDSLVLLSSIFPQPLLKEDHSIFLTNDKQFYNSFSGNEKERMSSIDNVLDEHGLSSPYTFKIEEIKLANKKALNLCQSLEKDVIDTFVSDFIFEHIKLKNNNLLLGKTLNCESSGNLKKELFCFELIESQGLENEMYTVVIYKNGLEIDIYTHHSFFTGFYCYREIDSFPYHATEDVKSRRISLRLKDAENNFIDKELMEKITSKGNLVFIHPDSKI